MCIRDRFISWLEGDKGITSYHVPPRGQQLIFDEDFEGRIKDGGILDTAINAIESTQRNELEEGIVRAIYWYSDAQRDLALIHI